MQADHRAALLAHEVLHGDAERKSKPAALADDLVGCEFFARWRPANLRHGHEVFLRAKTLHANRMRLQPQILVERGYQRLKIVNRLVTKGIRGHGDLR